MEPHFQVSDEAALYLSPVKAADESYGSYFFKKLEVIKNRICHFINTFQWRDDNFMKEFFTADYIKNEARRFSIIDQGRNDEERQAQKLSSLMSVEPSEILPGLFLSNQTAIGFQCEGEDLQGKRKRLIDKEIKNIFCCAGENDLCQRFADIIGYVHEPLNDAPNQILEKEFFNKTFKIIEDRRDSNILVQCNAGASRSASIVIAYLMKKYNVSFNSANLFVRSRRECVDVSNFAKSLRDYENRSSQPSQ